MRGLQAKEEQSGRARRRGSERGLLCDVFLIGRWTYFTLIYAQIKGRGAAGQILDGRGGQGEERWTGMAEADKRCASINLQTVQIEISKQIICPIRVGGSKQNPAASRSRENESKLAASSQPAAISLQQFGGVCCRLVLCYRAKSVKLTVAITQR